MKYQDNCKEQQEGDEEGEKEMRRRRSTERSEETGGVKDDGTLNYNKSILHHTKYKKQKLI